MNKQELLRYLKERGFSENIVRAFEKIKREDFISENLKKFAYEDNPLPIGYGQTISQPYTIAFMLDLLELDNLNKKSKIEILEIGSGSGYVLALIDEILKNKKIDYRIYGIERVKELVGKSKKVLKDKKKTSVVYGDGSSGLKKRKFDRILVSASADEIPSVLIKQLNNNGILVIPVKNSIFKIRRKGKKIIEEEYQGFIFVPLVND